MAFLKISTLCCRGPGGRAQTPPAYVSLRLYGASLLDNICAIFPPTSSFTCLRSSSDLRYHISSLLIAPWLSVIYARNSTFANYSVSPLHKSPMLQETQTAISLIQTIIVPRCRASTGTTRALLHLKYLQTKAVNCAVCSGVPGRRL